MDWAWCARPDDIFAASRFSPIAFLLRRWSPLLSRRLLRRIGGAALRADRRSRRRRRHRRWERLCYRPRMLSGPGELGGAALTYAQNDPSFGICCPGQPRQRDDHDLRALHERQRRRRPSSNAPDAASDGPSTSDGPSETGTADAHPPPTPGPTRRSIPATDSAEDAPSDSPSDSWHSTPRGDRRGARRAPRRRARRASPLALSLSLPIVAAAAVVGFIVAAFQAATQIQDPTVAHLPPAPRGGRRASSSSRPLDGSRGWGRSPRECSAPPRCDRPPLSAAALTPPAAVCYSVEEMSESSLQWPSRSEKTGLRSALATARRRAAVASATSANPHPARGGEGLRQERLLRRARER